VERRISKCSKKEKVKKNFNLKNYFILKIFTFDYSFQTWENSGILKNELRLYQKLEENGYKFIFLTYGDEGDIKYEKYFKNSTVIPIYSKIRLPKFKVIRILQSFLIPAYFYKSLKNVKLIKHNQLLGVWVAIILKIILGVPLYVRTGYDMYTFSKLMRVGKIKVTLYYFLTQLALLSSNLYSVSSKTDLNFLRKKYIFTNKIKIRKNSVDVKDTGPFIKRIENEIICVGRLEKQKNYEYIIKEFSNSKIQINIYGEGSLRKELEILAKKENTKVEFKGMLDNDLLNNELKNYKYYIIASYFEGNPKSLLEAMANGCAVFASSIPNNKEIVEDKVTGYLFDLKTNELKNVFFNVKQNDILKVASSGREFINKNYSVKKAVKKEIEDYKDLIDLRY